MALAVILAAMLIASVTVLVISIIWVDITEEEKTTIPKRITEPPVYGLSRREVNKQIRQMERYQRVRREHIRTLRRVEGRMC